MEDFVSQRTEELQELWGNHTLSSLFFPFSEKEAKIHALKVAFNSCARCLKYITTGAKPEKLVTAQPHVFKTHLTRFFSKD